MKVVICEKPLVAKRLARILGADKMEDGYLIGNGYAVTWTFGHLLAPVSPFSCMEGPFTREMLPLAVPSGLAVRRTRTEDGFRDDPVAVRQLEVIRRLLQEADGAVTATDTSREGQMVARNLYDYLGFKGKT